MSAHSSAPGVLALAILTMTAAAGHSQGIAVDGADRARMLPPAGARVQGYVNAGYRLQVEDGEARVEVDASPLWSGAPYSAPARFPRAATGKLAQALVAGATTRYEAASRILGWMSRTIAYRVDHGAPQDPESVLRRRNAYCTGFARLAVALLQAAGIESREVAGWVADDRAGTHAGRFHRWIEVYYPDRGWVFSDPAATHHYVPATYVRLADERVAGPGADGVLLQHDGRLTPADVYLQAAPGIRARRNVSLQIAASLRVVVSGTPAGQAVLEGPGLRRSCELQGGEAFFGALEPGSYVLRVLRGGTVARRRVELRGRIRAAIGLPVGL